MKEVRKKEIPIFTSEEEERKFWSLNDSVEYVDYSTAEKAVFTDLKPTSKAIALRLSDYLLYKLKHVAHSKKIPYHALLVEMIEKELKEENSL